MLMLHLPPVCVCEEVRGLPVQWVAKGRARQLPDGIAQAQAGIELWIFRSYIYDATMDLDLAMYRV